MGWIKQSRPPCKHKDRPKLGQYYNSSTEHMVGDIWECDECKSQFSVTVKRYHEGMSWDRYEVNRLEWEFLTVNNVRNQQGE